MKSENRAPETKRKAPRSAFKKGQSGNPGGRPKGVAEVREMAQAMTAETMPLLLSIARTADSDSARVSAIKEIHDRAWGKASQALDVTHSVADLTDEQLEARYRALLEKQSEPPTEGES